MDALNACSKDDAVIWHQDIRDIREGVCDAATNMAI